MLLVACFLLKLPRFSDYIVMEREKKRKERRRRPSLEPDRESLQLSAAGSKSFASAVFLGCYTFVVVVVVTQQQRRGWKK